MITLNLKRGLIFGLLIAISGCNKDNPFESQHTMDVVTIDPNLIIPPPVESTTSPDAPTTAKVSAESKAAEPCAPQPSDIYSQGIGWFWCGASESIAPGGWWGISIPRNYLFEGYVALATVTPYSGNPDVYAFIWDYSTSKYTFLRGSAMPSGFQDETHVFHQDIANDNQMAVIWVHQDDKAPGPANFGFQMNVRRDIPLLLPTPNPPHMYTPATIPISAIEDNNIDAVGTFLTYDCVSVQRASDGVTGCQKYLGPGNYAPGKLGEAADPSNPDPNKVVILGYQNNSGKPMLTGIRYEPGTDKSFVWYDQHTGYDFVPGFPGVSEGTPVYAAFGGVVRLSKFCPDCRAPDPTYNEIVIDHGGGWTTHYLHMQKEGSKYVQDECYIGTGYRIGTIGHTGIGSSAASSHLHFTVKLNCNSNSAEGGRRDPYRYTLWR